MPGNLDLIQTSSTESSKHDLIQEENFCDKDIKSQNDTSFELDLLSTSSFDYQENQ